MRDKPVPLFINPTAGHGRAGRRLETIIKLLHEGGVEIDVHPSKRMGDVERQVRTAIEDGAAQLIIAGGDGHSRRSAPVLATIEAWNCMNIA